MSKPLLVFSNENQQVIVGCANERTLAILIGVHWHLTTHVNFPMTKILLICTFIYSKNKLNT